MLRKRLVTMLTFVDGVLFRTKKYDPDYRYTHNFVDAWSIDEITMLDITRDGYGVSDSFLSVIADFANRCFVPLTAGGGVRNLQDVKKLLDAGADKVVVNSGAIERPELIADIANAYGAQCAVVSMDTKKISDGQYEIYSHFGKKPTGMTPIEWAVEAEKFGAGEFIVSSIDKDGSLEGFDVTLCKQIVDAVSVPVVISAGCGNWKHIVAAFEEGGADAACLTNIYHVTDTSIQNAKKFLKQKNISVRE